LPKSSSNDPVEGGDEHPFFVEIASLDRGASMLPQWALIGSPGQYGQVSPAALSQALKTKSAACMIKGIERVTAVLKFELRGVEVRA
jgi:hypothetical protein